MAVFHYNVEIVYTVFSSKVSKAPEVDVKWISFVIEAIQLPWWLCQDTGSEKAIGANSQSSMWWRLHGHPYSSQPNWVGDTFFHFESEGQLGQNQLNLLWCGSHRLHKPMIISHNPERIITFTDKEEADLTALFIWKWYKIKSHFRM